MLKFIVLFAYCFVALYADEYVLVSRVQYGELAHRKDFPFYATLEKCSAAIISDSWLVTAAECAAIDGGKVQIGTDGVHEYDEAIIHPDYSMQKDGRDHTNNIALLKLTKPLTFSATVQPVNLPWDARDTYGVHTVVGNYTDTYENSDNLLKLNVSILSTEECLSHFSLAERIKMYSYRYDLWGICTKRVSPYLNLPGLCDGDSGVALVNDNSLIGLAISSDVDCKKGLAMFIKVATHTNWIKFITGISTVTTSTGIPYTYWHQETTESVVRSRYWDLYSKVYE